MILALKPSESKDVSVGNQPKIMVAFRELSVFVNKPFVLGFVGGVWNLIVQICS